MPTTKKHGFSDFEKDAMKERAQELIKDKTDGESAVLAKIAAMDPSDRLMAERIHAIVKNTAPMLTPKTWYGMPAYANTDGKVVCFFQDAKKFKTRYSTLGFGDTAKLDEGDMWPNAYALTQVTPTVEKMIVRIIKQAVGYK